MKKSKVKRSLVILAVITLMATIAGTTASAGYFGWSGRDGAYVVSEAIINEGDPYNSCWAKLEEGNWSKRVEGTEYKKWKNGIRAYVSKLNNPFKKAKGTYGFGK